MDCQKNIITKETIIRCIAEDKNESASTIRSIYNALEETVFHFISSVKPDKAVSVKLFEGISIDGIYVPEKQKLNNLSGKMNTVASKIKPKVNITKSYCKKINSVKDN